MIISDATKSLGNSGEQTISATVTFETVRPLTLPLYIRFTSAPGEIEASCTPFLMSFLVAALVLGEDIEVRGAVDGEVLDRIERDIIPLLRRWFPFLHPIEVRCSERRPPGVHGGRDRGTSSAFSGGLDAVYTVLTYRNEVRWLVASEGFDCLSHRPKLCRVIAKRIRTMADAIGLPLYWVESNVRESCHTEMIRILGGRVHPGVYTIGPGGALGPYLAALGRSMESFCHRFLISASEPVDKLLPGGTHPLFDSAWTTSTQEVRHAGCEADRTGKFRRIRRDAPELLKHLRVCHNFRAGYMNCGTCEKCLRSMLEAHLADIPESALSFAAPLDLERVRWLSVRPAQHKHWAAIVSLAAARGEYEIARSAAIAAGDRPYLPRILREGWPRRFVEDPALRWKWIRRRMAPRWDAGESGTPPPT